MTKLDVGASLKRTSTTSGVDPAEADVVVEFFSASHGKWIPVEVIEKDESNGSVQVSAKPGVWLSAKDCQRKLRARIFLDDPAVGSTIRPAAGYLQVKAKTIPTLAPHLSCGNRVVGSDENSIGRPSKGFSEAPRIGVNRVIAEAIQLESSVTTTSDAGHPRMAPGASVAGNTQAPSPKSLSATDPAKSQPFQASKVPGGLTTACGMPKLPRRKGPSNASSFSCPQCGATDLASFEMAVQHCYPAGSASQAPTLVFDSQSRTPTIAIDKSQSTSITDLPSPTSRRPGFQAGQQRNGLRYLKTNTVPVAMPKEKEPETGEPSPVERVSPPQPPKDEQGRFIAQVEGVWSLPVPPLEPASDEPDWTAEDEPGKGQPGPPGTWNCDVGGETDSTRSSEGQRPAAPGQPIIDNSWMGGDAIAYNIRGEPIITRTVSSDTGAGVTSVLNDDGSKCTFGKNTLASLMSSDETDAQSWIASLTTLETRGLVHEIGQVLLSTSSVYQYHLKRLEALSDKANYAFFGLSEDATDADVDRAYKKLAKQMHPDKNGGTEFAKERFQQMKERYEALKKHRSSQDASDDGKKGDDEKDEDADEVGDKDESKEEKRKEAYDEDDDAPKEKKSDKISYDPTDQDSLASTALEMLQRLKAIEGSMTTVLDQLGRHGL